MSALAEQILSERRQAMRALLVRPLLTASGAGETLALVRVHAVWLREWLGRNCGWTLQVEGELARLRKTPGDLTDATRGARDRTSDLPFSRRRYSLFCLALASLERADRQTTLGNVARDVLGALAGEPAFAGAGLTFDFESRDARRDLVHVVRLLIELRVLVRVEGQEEHFVDGRGDVLYNVSRSSLAALLAVRRGPSTVTACVFTERLEAVVDEPWPDSDEARNRRLRVTLTRRLIDDPVVYFDDLDDDERAYLTSQRAHILRQIQEATGLVGEVRREGIALVDPEGLLTDESMPEEGTEGHVTLLVAEFLAAESRKGAAATRTAEASPSPSAKASSARKVAVPLAAIVAHVGALKRQHQTHWRKDALAPSAEVLLAQLAVSRLEALRLCRRIGDVIEPLPALGRFRLLPPTTRPRRNAASAQTGLFE